jgi:hypothetical protein
MTNRDMVKGKGPPRPDENKRSKAERAPRRPLQPAPESEDAVYTDREPLDSPQPAPNEPRRRT